jgi:hypothetical protein
MPYNVPQSVPTDPTNTTRLIRVRMDDGGSAFYSAFDISVKTWEDTSMSMNERVATTVREQADAFYEGRVSSAEALRVIDGVANHFFNYYPGILNDAHQAFDLRVSHNIDRDVDEHRSETYASRMLRELRDAGTQPDEDFFRMKVTGNGETKWFNVTPAQMDALIRVFEV